ncbi:MAG: alpha/beta hydrolase-fold protein [Pirellulales bacterium]
MTYEPRIRRTWGIPAFVIWLTSFFLGGCAQQEIKVLPHDELKLDSKILGETRVINVYLPPKYMDGNERFPVLYMPDGGVKEDFPHIRDTIHELIADGSISPVILVGIENTIRHRDLTGPTDVVTDIEKTKQRGGSKDFRSFIRDELIPMIEKQYRCNSERAIVGESLAGLFVVETCLLEPTLFDRYIAMDPSLWWNDHQLVARESLYQLAENSKPIHLWFAASKVTDILPHAQELSELLGFELTETHYGI